MVVPLGLLKLSENIWVQLVSFVLIIFIVLQWIVTFFIHGLDTSLVPVVGPDISQTFGTILFNYAFITTVPSWANAKQPSVSIHKTVGWGVGITTTIYIAIAILGGMAYHIPNNSSLIQAISSSPDVSILSQITGYTFPIAALITSIPINIIVIRYNLIQSGACNMIWANILSGILPWFIAIPCMTGSGLTTIINWSSLILVSAANFVIPFILYIYSKKHKEKLSNLPIIEMEQQARISRELSRSSFSGHSRRNHSISGSIRQRCTGSSLHSYSQSQHDLNSPLYTCLSSAIATPIAIGIATPHPDSHEENILKEITKEGLSHPSSAHDIGEHISGPYFSFSRDGELFERESKAGNAPDPSSKSQVASQRPSGVSTVVLHDPGTEPIQRKTPLPRRISHKDKLLSMISDKHKRAMEQQAKKLQEGQSEKPMPPMILLSQSATSEIEDQSSSKVDSGIISKRNDSQHSESSLDGDMETGGRSIPTKRLNRKSYMMSSRTQDYSNFNLSPSSPPPRISATAPVLHCKLDSMPYTPSDDNLVKHQEFSSTLSPPRSPGSPQRSNVKRSPSSSPSRHSPRGGSKALPRIDEKDGHSIELPVPDFIHLGSPPDLVNSGLGITSSQPINALQPFEFSNTTSPVDRRVSFSNDLRQPGLEHKCSFGGESKRTFKAAVSTVAGGTTRLNSNFEICRDAGTGMTSPEYRAILLEAPEEDETGNGGDSNYKDSSKTRNIDQATETDEPINFPPQFNGERRDSLGRMAAAFSSQPGSFSIKTTLSVPKPIWKDDYKLPGASPQLEANSPFTITHPSFQAEQGSSGRNRTVSASAAFQGRKDSRKTHAVRSQSIHSLKEDIQRNQLAVPESANSLSNRLAPPSSSHSNRSSSPSSTFSGSSDNQRATLPSIPLNHRVSGGGHSVKMSVSGKTLSAPFQSGNNYSFPGLGLGHSPSSSYASQSPGIFGLDNSAFGQSFPSSWFRRSHSREASRSSTGMPHSPAPPSPRPSLLDSIGIGTCAVEPMRLESPTTPRTDISSELTLNLEKFPSQESRTSQYVLEGGLALEAMKSLHAIPEWIPISSLKVAWGSLGILLIAISSTVIYDFVQLGMGNDVMGG
ncbi:hypothetical protein BGZ76_005730 [Entomortierella beljakovae]|nr:hypothetical protein BGZ76_005730 [Entomortierella beljakovae]